MPEEATPLAALSHEIRTPLAAVVGLSELLLDTALDERQRALAATIRASGQHLLAVAEGMLSLASLEAGAPPATPTVFDPAALADEALAIVAPTAQAKGLTLQRRVAPGTPARVRADATRVRQILLNLLANAVKFTAAGGVTVTVGPGLSFEVRDTGPGVPPALAERLFRPFVQGEGAAAQGGAGLGLAISRRLAERLGGSLSLQSAAGEGAVFSLQVPAENVEDPPPARPDTRPALRAHRVLLVEDDPLHLQIASHMLAKLGQPPPDVARDAFEALSAVERNPYDVVLLDLELPGLDGLAAARLLRERLGSSAPRLVALTAHAGPAERARCLAAGLDDHLSKPLGAEALAAALGAVPAVLDARAFRALCDAYDLDCLAEIAASLDRERPRREAELLRALEARDAAALARQAHSLKGLARMLGGLGLDQVCDEVERLGRSDPTAALARVPTLLAEWDAFVTALGSACRQAAESHPG